MRQTPVIVALLLTVFLIGPLSDRAKAESDAPPDVASAMVLKLVALEKNIASLGGEVAIHVIGSPALAEALAKAVGKTIGKSTLGRVTGSDGLPPYKPEIICLSDASMLEEVIAYSRKEKVMTATDSPGLATGGIALGIGVDDSDKAAVFLNLTASKAEGLDWNPAIMKVAKIVK